MRRQNPSKLTQGFHLQQDYPGILDRLSLSGDIFPALVEETASDRECNVSVIKSGGSVIVNNSHESIFLPRFDCCFL